MITARSLALAAACAAAAFVFSPAASSAPEDPPAATTPYSSSDERVTISLPAEWTLAGREVEKAAIALDGQLPDQGGLIAVTVYHLPGMVNPRTQPFAERTIHPERYGLKDPAHPETDVLPHLWMDDPGKGGSAIRHVWIYRVIRRNGFTTHIQCTAEAWPKVREQCLRAALSLTTTLDEWPAPPAGYKRRVRDGIVYYVHAAAGESDAAVHAVVRAEQQAFAKLHGAPLPLPESPMVVVVHAKPMDAFSLSDDAAKATGGEHYDGSTYRLFAVAPAKGDDAARAMLAREARMLVYAQAMGRQEPYWLFCGEAAAAWNEATTGKPLPTVADGFNPRTLKRFDEVAGYWTAADGNWDAMLVYFAFFRCGPKPYRDAFAAFLKDAAATGDILAAQKARLLSLDQEALWNAAAAFMKDLKPAKPK